MATTPALWALDWMIQYGGLFEAALVLGAAGAGAWRAWGPRAALQRAASALLAAAAAWVALGMVGELFPRTTLALATPAPGRAGAAARARSADGDAGAGLRGDLDALPRLHRARQLWPVRSGSVVSLDELLVEAHRRQLRDRDLAVLLRRLEAERQGAPMDLGAHHPH